MANDFGRLEKFPYGNWETIYDRNIFVFCKKYFFPIKKPIEIGYERFYNDSETFSIKYSAGIYRFI